MRPDPVPMYAVVIGEMNESHVADYFAATSTILQGFRMAERMRGQAACASVVVDLADGYDGLHHKNHLFSIRMGRYDHEIDALASGEANPYYGGSKDARNQATKHVAKVRRMHLGRGV